MTKNATVGDEPDYLWTQWISKAGTVFEFLEHDWQGGLGGGHCYPGASGKVGCGTNTPVQYGEIALQFYNDHLNSKHIWAATETAHIDSRMSRSVWFGGQDWVGPHRLVGRSTLRSLSNPIR
jgi:hypothetical protein